MAKKVITIKIGKKKTSVKADNVSLRDFDIAQSAIEDTIDRIRTKQFGKAIKEIFKED